MDIEDLAYAEPSGGLIDWVNNYGNVVYFLGQVIFWLGMLIFVGYAVYQFKRWVNYQLGVGKSGALRNAESDETPQLSSTTAQKVSVDQFVE